MAKRTTGRQPGLLQKIDDPSKPWDTIHMDFITALPKAGLLSYDAVLVITCRMTKCIRLVLTHGDADAKLAAQRFAQAALPTIGLPRVIISDRDPKFTSSFWEALHAILQIHLAMTTAHHPQADGLVERHIGTLSESIRTFCGFDSTRDLDGLTIDWSTLICVLEYAYNSSTHSATKIAPFVLERGYIPRGPADVYHDLSGLAATKVDPHAEEWASTILAARQRALDSIAAAFAGTKERWDAKHKEQLFKVGDLVRVSTRHFSFQGTSRKLQNAFLGPFRITEKINDNAFRVGLQDPWKDRHDVFSTVLLAPYRDTAEFIDRRPDMPVAPEPVIENDGQEVFEVERILADRKLRGSRNGREYLVRWKGYLPAYDRWESEENLNEDALVAYRSRAGTVTSGRKVRGTR